MLSPPAQKLIENDAKRTRWPAATVAHQRKGDHIERHPILDGDTRHHGRVGCHDAGHGIHTVVAQKELADAAVRISANGRPELQPQGLDIERLGLTPVWKSFACRDSHGPLADQTNGESDLRRQ
jgi:hypothetical protein